MKSTFYDTGIIMCIPAMLFGVSLSINIDEENIKWAKTNIGVTIIRLFIAFWSTFAIELLIYHFTSRINNFATLYVWRYLVNL
jgi:hypothetical protein